MRLLINTVLFYIGALAICTTVTVTATGMWFGLSLHMSVLLAFTNLFGLHGNALADFAPYLLWIAALLLTLNRFAALPPEKGSNDENANSLELLGTSPVRDEPV